MIIHATGRDSIVTGMPRPGGGGGFGLSTGHSAFDGAVRAETRGQETGSRTGRRVRPAEAQRIVGTRTSNALKEFFDAMHKALGPQHWWPAKTPFEMIVGAILTQNTSWKNVERAIENLRNAGCLDAAKLRDIDIADLAQLIRPAGYFNVKAKRLKSFVTWFWGRYEGDLDRMFAARTATLREELLSISGIGRETGDSILLYAAGKPSFVVDTYTYRILRRHRLIDDEADYEQIKDLFESNLPEDVKLFNEYHALLVAVGKDHCRPKARCAGCPLERFEHELESEEG